MATIKTVVLKEKGKIKVNVQGETTIYLQYGHDQKVFRLNTGVRIPPNVWRGDRDQNNPIGGETKGRAKRNSTIARYRRQLEDAKDAVLAKGIPPSIEAIKRELEVQNKGPDEANIFALWEQYVADSRVTKTESTVKQIRRSQRVFADYWQKKPVPPVESLDIDFYHSYKKFLLNKRQLNNNSAGKEIKVVKSFLNYLRDRGYTISPDVAKFKILREKVSVVYLTQSELQQLYEHDFSRCPRLDRVRDLFVFQASTGLRWSDIARLAPEHIQDGIIKMTAYKNKKETLVPLIPSAREILAKYDGKLPIIAEQNVNLYIKEACKLAGIDTPVEKVTYTGGKKKFETVPKYELITTHKAVSTFITHCGERGISAKVVSEITGKTVKVILDHYYGISKETIISEMTKAFGV